MNKCNGSCNLPTTLTNEILIQYIAKHKGITKTELSAIFDRSVTKITNMINQIGFIKYTRKHNILNHGNARLGLEIESS